MVTLPMTITDIKVPGIVRKPPKRHLNEHNMMTFRLRNIKQSRV